MLKIDPGEMRMPVQYQTRTQTGRDRTGTPIYAWTTQWTAYAAVRPLSMKELFAQGGQTAQRQYRVFMRWRSGVSTGGRLILSDGRTLELTSVLNVDERGVYLDLQATETGAGG